ncbi:hypothetical protein K1719_015295 [Acacia pycnantha]|nr:hypothetical protein K1719_015295 [Acacia pycnantha]
MEVLKETLIRHGFTFESETDTEVIFQNLQSLFLIKQMRQKAWPVKGEAWLVFTPSPKYERTNRPSFSSSNGYDDTPVHAGVSNGDDYDSDSSNFAPYGNSVFFHVRKMSDPIGLLPPEKYYWALTREGFIFSVLFQRNAFTQLC